MPGINLLYVYQISDPEKKFLVCDLNNGRTFEDPLILFEIPEYDIHSVNEQGLYAIGGNLDIGTLVKSYKWGIFPWFPYKECEEADWYCPRRRYVIFPDKIHVSHSLRNILNKDKYIFTINQSFREVIHQCRMVNGRDNHEQAWLSDTIEKLFIELYELGYAKSVEVWEGEELVGGFYGFWYNGVFQGDSMFSLRPSASQIGLILLCRHGSIEAKKIKFIDTQFETPTFKRLGGEYISYQKYRELMDL
ncbi:MAG: leucyl/phenylalanyl-tRNA--protein transferase [Muribaculaceae bacterium]|nr:leucyl/phenylalanyl-tRNA--protein transferase [Muribaculaceae bacterium]